MSTKLPPDLRALRVFLIVAECESMSLAAARLKMTQPSVSHAIRQLETYFDARLLDRDRRPLRLTAAGQVLRGRAETLVDGAETLRAAVRYATKSPPPEIRLGLVDTFAATAGPSFVKALLESASRISVWSGLSRGLCDSLLRRDLDLVVTTLSLDDVDGLERSPLWHEPLLLALPAGLKWSSERNSLATLATSRPLIRYSARSHLGTQIDQHLRRLGLDVPRGHHDMYGVFQTPPSQPVAHAGTI